MKLLLNKVLQSFSGGIARVFQRMRHALQPDSNAMVLRQTHFWSRAILWTIIGTFVVAVVWAFLAPIDEVIHAFGKLEPRGSARDVQSPVSGVIDVSMVREGDTVKVGQILVRIDSNVAAAEVKSLEERYASMQAERAFYDRLFNNGDTPQSAPEGVPREITDLAKNRSAIVAENKLLRRLRDETGELHSAILETEYKTFDGEDEGPVARQLRQMKVLVDGEIAREQGLELDADNLKYFGTELTNLAEQYQSIREQLVETRKIAENKNLAFEAFSKLNKQGNLSRVDYLAHEAAWMAAAAQVKNLESEAKTCRLYSKSRRTTGFRKMQSASPRSMRTSLRFASTICSESQRSRAVWLQRGKIWPTTRSSPPRAVLYLNLSQQNRGQLLPRRMFCCVLFPAEN